MRRLENEFTWSVSRDQSFRECQRAYYYHYYGSWGGWEDDAPEDVRKLYVLKNVKTMPMWAGSVVHETIAEALNRYARKQTPIRTGELQAAARQKLRNGWLEAVNREWLRSPKKTNLHELYYGDGKTAPREQTERIKERVYDCLAAFAESSLLSEILAVPYVDWKPVDQLDSFSLHGLKVWCAIDFAYVDPAGHLRILDWKTGAEREAALKTQLACYALYAAQEWYTPLDKIRLYGCFLREKARLSEYEAAPELLVDAQDRIVTSAAEMREKLVDVEANAAREDDFPYCEDERACVRCNFKEVCPFVAG